MYKIVKKQELTTNIYLMEVEADRVAKTCEPGQFVIVRMDSEGERIPLTICDYNREKGTVTIVFQTVGAGTKLMAQLEEGEYFHDFVGPLGCPSELVEQPLDEVKAKKILYIGTKIRKKKDFFLICLKIVWFLSHYYVKVGMDK